MAVMTENAIFEHKMNRALSEIINKVEGGGVFTLFALAGYSQELLQCSDDELSKRFPRSPHAGKLYRELARQVLPIVDEAFN